MALVTDSYCERCGTRYVFQAPPSKALSIRGARVLAKGLRNFVLNDGQSFNDSLGFARSEDQTEDSSRLTQAFHKAFNFCMTCRQYACEKCWNVKVGACFTCAPLAAVAPAAPENHLIVRTPVIRVEGDRTPGAPPSQDFLVGPSGFGNPSATAEQAPFDADRLADEHGPATVPEAPLWPEADRSVFEAPAPASRTPEWLLRRGSLDGETGPEHMAQWSLWPIGDALAPEMTLTPEELSAVSAQLASKPELDSPDEIDAAVADVIAQVPAASERRVEPRAVAAEPWAAAAEAIAEHRAAAAELIAEPVAELQPAAEVATQPVAEPQLAADVATEPVAEPQLAAEPIVASVPLEEAPTHQANPLSRLFGKHPARNEQPLPEALMALRGTPSNGSWPHVTPWVERPVRTYAPIFGDERVESSAEVGAEPEAVAGLEVPPLSTPAEFAETAPTAGYMPEGAEEPREPREPASIVPVAAASEPEEPAPVVPVAAAPLPVEPEAAGFAEMPFSAAWQRRVKAAQAAAQAMPEPVQPAARVPAPMPAPAAPVQPAAVQPTAPVPAPMPAPAAPVQPAAVQPAVLRPAAVQPAPVQPAVVQPSAPVPAAPIPAPAPADVDRQPAGWPPLGAQYPAPLYRGPVWPPAEGVASSAAVLSSQTARTEMWVQSSQEVMNRGTVRVCLRCSLPLSTQARFCRRCGTSQS